MSENKQMLIISGIIVVAIVAAVQNRWDVVNAILYGAFAILTPKGHTP